MADTLKAFMNAAEAKIAVQTANEAGRAIAEHCDARIEKAQQEMAILKKALASKDEENGRLRSALESSGKTKVFYDGFDACAAVVKSLTLRVSWGDKATPDDGVEQALESVRKVVQRARDAMVAANPPSAEA